MHRLAAPIVLIIALLAVLATPAMAGAAGCEVLRDAGDRAECEAREQAREAARAEVARQVDGATPSSSSTSGRSGAWQDAVDEASGFDPGALIEPRPIAAVGGLAWFVLIVRSRRRRRSARSAG